MVRTTSAHVDPRSVVSGGGATRWVQVGVGRSPNNPRRVRDTYTLPPLYPWGSHASYHWTWMEWKWMEVSLGRRPFPQHHNPFRVMQRGRASLPLLVEDGNCHSCSLCDKLVFRVWYSTNCFLGIQQIVSQSHIFVIFR